MCPTSDPARRGWAGSVRSTITAVVPPPATSLVPSALNDVFVTPSDRSVITDSSCGLAGSSSFSSRTVLLS
ncbi:hypothetical protein FKR81_18400 [Lentzea tibetensis]|uniref:Uncharacterized protein n=1 Tax=Lentzea tibetensis TaxID=2591470 RepID=A0A563ETM1_9PSEU|nr:hypothetical protein [Lentzea tibetensis]TWP51039.1 hypothetical protein FKR81_18400 [Lentzea tibetensis]